MLLTICKIIATVVARAGATNITTTVTAAKPTEGEDEDK